ncbi:MAG: hypothetical protein M1142_00650 [Patescibacteria group bacterium]|nr:hypothetical protein [Patescibacteria group bacterium]
MNYLERNERILQEVSRELQDHTLRRGKYIGSSKGYTNFVSAGSFLSPFLKREAFTGIKEIGIKNFTYSRVRCELLTIAVIAEHLPHLAPELPLFYGHFETTSGGKGIIMEDFSQGKKLKVDSVPGGITPPELKTFFEDVPGIFFDDYGLCFLVDGKRKMGDFDKILGLGYDEQLLEGVLDYYPIGLSYKDYLTYLQRIKINLDYNL